MMMRPSRVSPRSAALSPGRGFGGGDERRGDWRTGSTSRPKPLGSSTAYCARLRNGPGESGRPSDRDKCSERSEGLFRSGLPAGFRAGRWCWPYRAGVPSRDGTAGLGRTVWSTTTQRKGRSVERPIECRGRLVWRTRRRWAGRCRWPRQASLEAALSRARTTSGWALTLGRARILRAVLRNAGSTGGTLRTPSDASRTPA